MRKLVRLCDHQFHFENELLGNGRNTGNLFEYVERFCDHACRPMPEELEEVEERTIRAAMERYNGNLTHVAKSLNISRPTLYTKLKKYNI